MYVELEHQYAAKYAGVRPQPPASENEICEAEKRLTIQFPSELRNLLAEMNGDRWLCWSTNQIIENNMQMREAFQELADLSRFLFFADNGCGDCYGYQIQNQTIQPSPIYIWNHEDFEARIVAPDIAEMIRLYYQDQI